ncbi:MAG: hypothetical protein ACYC8T_31540 [Myxococcaceae bacterium]
MSSSLVDVAFEVCSALARHGFVAVLTGGSAATYYAPDAYQSCDLDFVLTFRGTDGDQALQALGYQRRGDFYVHAASPFPLEFPPGPLAIGEDSVTTWSTVKRGDEVLHILTPTDSCRDRLASYLFWTDLSGLEQALAVHLARPEEVDLHAVREWCRREGHARKFELYEARLASAPRRPGKGSGG